MLLEPTIIISVADTAMPSGLVEPMVWAAMMSLSACRGRRLLDALWGSAMANDCTRRKNGCKPEEESKWSQTGRIGPERSRSKKEKALETADSRALEMVAGAGFEPATFGL
jgi:hypothetical protein